MNNDNETSVPAPLWRISAFGFRQDIHTNEILSHVRSIYGHDVTMPWLPGRAGNIVRVRRGRKVVATVALLEGER